MPWARAALFLRRPLRLSGYQGRASRRIRGEKRYEMNPGRCSPCAKRFSSRGIPRVMRLSWCVVPFLQQYLQALNADRQVLEVSGRHDKSENWTTFKLVETPRNVHANPRTQRPASNAAFSSPSCTSRGLFRICVAQDCKRLFPKRYHVKHTGEDLDNGVASSGGCGRLISGRLVRP